MKNIVLFLILFPNLLFSQPADQISALVDLYDATDGSNWLRNDNWLIGSPCAQSWDGVHCNEFTGEVLSLFLGANGLNGTIPDSFESLSSSLDEMEFSSNQLRGTIPDFLGNFLVLQYLYLNDNNFMSPLPNFLQVEPDLVSYNLQNNSFTCPVPFWCGIDGNSDCLPCECPIDGSYSDCNLHYQESTGDENSFQDKTETFQYSISGASTYTEIALELYGGVLQEFNICSTVLASSSFNSLKFTFLDGDTMMCDCIDLTNIPCAYFSSSNNDFCDPNHIGLAFSFDNEILPCEKNYETEIATNGAIQTDDDDNRPDSYHNYDYTFSNENVNEYWQVENFLSVNVTISITVEYPGSYDNNGCQCDISNYSTSSNLNTWWIVISVIILVTFVFVSFLLFGAYYKRKSLKQWYQVQFNKYQEVE